MGYGSVPSGLIVIKQQRINTRMKIKRKIEKTIEIIVGKLVPDLCNNFDFQFTTFLRWPWRKSRTDDVVDKVTFGGGPFYHFSYWG